MNIINTGTPRTVYDGIRDNSQRARPSPPLNIPRLMPVLKFFGKDGPLGEGLRLTPAQAAEIFDPDSFDYNLPYAKHTNILFEAIKMAGVTAEYERVAAPNIKTATLRLWVDILEASQVPQFRRNQDGTYVLDPLTQQPVPVATGPATLPGFIAKFKVTEATGGFGEAQEMVGNQVDSATGKQSRWLPLIDFAASFPGAAGSLKGLRIWAPTTVGMRPMRGSLLSNANAYPFRLSLIKKPDASSTAALVTTVKGDTAVDFVLKPRATDDVGGKKTLFHIGETLIDTYQDNSSELDTPLYSPIGGVFVYQKNIDDILPKIAAAEAKVPAAYSDLKNDADDAYRVNLFGGIHSTNAPYSTFMVVNNAQDSVRLSSNTDLLLMGGADGDLDIKAFETAVQVSLGGYTDQFNPRCKAELYPGNMFFDTGFVDKTKYALMAAKTLRGDVFTFINTYIDGSKELTVGEELSRGGMLNSRAMLYSESNIYATPCARIAIFAQSMKTPKFQYNKPMPAFMERVPMLLGYVCDGSNTWNSALRPDEEDNRYAKQIAYLSAPFLPAPLASQAWLNGLNWMEKVDGGRYTYQALRTVYTSDNSVLTGLLFVLSICSTRKVFEMTRVHYSGNQRLTPAEFIKAVDDRNNASLPIAAYDGHAIWTSKSTLTDVDQANGFSWTTVGEAKGAIGRTVQSLTFVVDRI